MRAPCARCFAQGGLVARGIAIALGTSDDHPHRSVDVLDVRHRLPNPLVVFCLRDFCADCPHTPAGTDKTLQRRDGSPPTCRRPLGLPPDDSNKGSGGLSIPSMGHGMGLSDDGWAVPSIHPSIICTAIEVPKSAMPHKNQPTPLACILLVPPTRVCRLSGDQLRRRAQCCRGTGAPPTRCVQRDCICLAMAFSWTIHAQHTERALHTT